MALLENAAAVTNDFINKIGKTVEAAEVTYTPQYFTTVTTATLPMGWAAADKTAFDAALDVQFYPRLGKFNVQGTIWFTDETWAVREQDESGSESWVLYERPAVIV